MILIMILRVEKNKNNNKYISIYLYIILTHMEFPNIHLILQHQWLHFMI